MPDDTPLGVGDSRLLAIDTSSDIAGVALFDGDDLHLRQWPCVRAQTTQVLPAIHSLLADAGVSLSDLACVAVASGPGAFTGLRVGMSLAKGFALGNAIPVIGISTLLATAFPWIRAGVSVIVVIPAGRGRLVWQRFDTVPDSVEEREEQAAPQPRNTTPLELVQAVRDDPVVAVVGELTRALHGALHDLPVPVIAGPAAPSRVGSIAALGFERHLRADHDDLATLEPQYVHGLRAATRTIVDPQP